MKMHLIDSLDIRNKVFCRKLGNFDIMLSTCYRSKYLVKITVDDSYTSIGYRSSRKGVRINYILQSEKIPKALNLNLHKYHETTVFI